MKAQSATGQSRRPEKTTIRVQCGERNTVANWGPKVATNGGFRCAGCGREFGDGSPIVYKH